MVCINTCIVLIVCDVLYHRTLKNSLSIVYMILFVISIYMDIVLIPFDVCFQYVVSNISPWRRGRRKSRYKTFLNAGLGLLRTTVLG